MDSCVSLWQGGSLFFFFILPWVKERKREREERGIVIDALWKTRGNTLLMLGKTLPGNLRIISLAAEEEMDADVLPGNFDDDDEPFLTINHFCHILSKRGSRGYKANLPQMHKDEWEGFANVLFYILPVDAPTGQHEVISSRSAPPTMR